MTRQYLAGELSLLLAELQEAVTDPAARRDVAHLREETEAGPLSGLPSVVVRAFELTDRLCWDSLQRGDVTSFTRQSKVCAELLEFGTIAGFLV